MIGLLIATIILVAIVASILHVSASAAWVIVIVGVVGVAIYQAKYGTTRRRTKTGVLFSSICPECRKHVKPNASRCQHCGSALVEQIVRPTPPTSNVRPAPSTSKTVCPLCREPVNRGATVCPHCRREIVGPVPAG